VRLHCLSCLQYRDVATAVEYPCPQCQCATHVIPGGQRRCQQCGHQFWPDGKAPGNPARETRRSRDIRSVRARQFRAIFVTGKRENDEPRTQHCREDGYRSHEQIRSGARRRAFRKFKTWVAIKNKLESFKWKDKVEGAGLRDAQILIDAREVFAEESIHPAIMSEDIIADALADIVGANNLPKLLRSIGEKELLLYTDPFMRQYLDSDIERRYGHQLKRIYHSHAKKLGAELFKVGRACVRREGGGSR
jgi:hypothetical protein